MIKKVYIYKVLQFLTYDRLCEFLNENEISPDKIVTITSELEYIKLIYWVKEFRDYRKDGTYEKIC